MEQSPLLDPCVPLNQEDSSTPSLYEQLKDVPQLPGVYLWKGSKGEVLYVGKAKRLRDRMKQYVMGQDEREKIPMLMAQVASFEYLVAQNEYESLVLEKNLIKQYRPPFNVDFKDDRSYPFIALTKGDLFPAIKYTREKHVPGTRYFGPYTDARAAKMMMDAVRRVVPLCSANCAEWKRLRRQLEVGQVSDGIAGKGLESVAGVKRCFDAHVGLGPGACCGDCDPQEYANNVAQVERFLSGSRQEFIKHIKAEMEEAAADLDFERAARCKKRIEAIEALQDKQHACSNTALNADVVAFYREETIAGVHVAVIREGNIIIGNEFVLDKGLDISDNELIHTFLVRYYDDASEIPREVVLEQLPDDAELIEAWLTEKLDSVHGAKVHLSVPARGEKQSLLEFAQRNARHTLMRYKTRTRYDDERINTAMLQLESALALPDPPLRIECFDISTIHGSHSVASMVVFTNGRPDKSQYRRFKIRMETDEANDFAMMGETLVRRFAPERRRDEAFGSMPDLLIVDGGKPQLTAALQQLEALGISDLPVAGLAKRDEELFVSWDQSGPVVLPSGSPALYLVKQVRDEAHRFAITFHRELRDKAMTQSILDEVEGLGPKRKKALMKYFGSMKKLRAASMQEIEEVPGIPIQVAQNVWTMLREVEVLASESAPTAHLVPASESAPTAHLVLASASPRRKELLAKAGFSFIVAPADIDEELDPQLPLQQALQQLALRKAQASLKQLGSEETRPVIASDTVVVLDGKVLGKPVSPQEAQNMLAQLSNNSHQVMTAVAIINLGEPITFCDISYVNFRELNAQEIADYVATGEPMDKAGAYAIQGGAAGFVESYQGDYDTIVGLPVTRVTQELAQRGVEPEA